MIYKYEQVKKSMARIARVSWWAMHMQKITNALILISSWQNAVEDSPNAQSNRSALSLKILFPGNTGDVLRETSARTAKAKRLEHTSDMAHWYRCYE